MPFVVAFVHLNVMNLNPYRKSASCIDENHKILIDILCKQYNGLKVVHFNARSLSGDKLDYIRDILGNLTLMLFASRKRGFNPDISDFYYCIPNFNLIRADRTKEKEEVLQSTAGLP